MEESAEEFREVAAAEGAFGGSHNLFLSPKE